MKPPIHEFEVVIRTIAGLKLYTLRHCYTGRDVCGSTERKTLAELYQQYTRAE